MTIVLTCLGDLYLDDQGAPDQPVALLWPSLFNDHTMWRHQIGPLRAAGWRTLALDPPGHGRSTGLERVFTMDDCAKAALEVLDALNVKTPVVLLGTSWGGMIAPRVALRAPDRVQGMVLFNTTAECATLFDRAKNTLLTKMLAVGALDKTVDRMIVSLNFSPGTRRRTPEACAALSRNYRSWDRHALIRAVRSVLVDRDATLHRLSSVKAPALVVSGEEDTLLPSRQSRRIAQMLANARHVEVSGAAHLVPLEAPDESNTLILNFIKTLAPA